MRMDGAARISATGKRLALVASAALLALVALLAVLPAPSEAQIVGRAIAKRGDVVDGKFSVLIQRLRPGNYSFHVALYDSNDQPVDEFQSASLYGAAAKNPHNFDVLLESWEKRMLLEADNPEGVQESTPDPFPEGSVPTENGKPKPYATSWGELLKISSSTKDTYFPTYMDTKDYLLVAHLADDRPNGEPSGEVSLSDAAYAIVTIREPLSTQALPSIASVESEVADRGSPARITVDAANPEGTHGLYYDFDCNNDGDYADAVDERDSEDNVGGCTFPERGTYQVTARIFDGQPFDAETTTVTVGNVAPVVELAGDATADEGQTRTYNFTVEDGSATHTVTTSCGTGGEKVTGSDSYDQQTRAGSFQCQFPNGPADPVVSVAATDDDGTSGEDSIGVRVANVAPVAGDQPDVSTEEDTAKPITLSATDAGGDPLSYRVTDLPDHGKLYKGTVPQEEITAAGTTLPADKVTYVPRANYNNTPSTPDTFGFRANDGLADGNEATASITVAPVKDPATVTLGGLTHTYDGTPKAATATTDPAGLEVDFAYRQDGQPVAQPTAAGSYEVTATVDDPDYEGEATGVLLIEDEAAPTVTATNPANKATGVRRAAPLTATFSEVMDKDTIGKSTFKLYQVTSTGTKQVTNVTVGLSPDGLVARLDPFGTSATVLAKNAQYKAVVTTGALDPAGNALDQSPAKAGGQQKAWTFTTGRR